MVKWAESFNKSASLDSKGIKHRLLVAFMLMGVIPLWIAAYLASYYILPHLNLLWSEGFWGVTGVICIGVIIALLGLKLAIEIVRPIIHLSQEARLIAEGDLTRQIKDDRQDETGDLARSMNKLARQLYENIEQLRDYEEEIQNVNLKIHKKMVVFSSLLQTGEAISSSSDFRSALKMICEEITRNLGLSRVFLILSGEREGKQSFITSVAHNLPELEGVMFTAGQGFMGKMLNGAQEPLIIDGKHPAPANAGDFLEKNQLKTLVVMPVLINGKVGGLLGVGGNAGDFVFQDDDLQVVDVFARQIALTVHNNSLVQRARELTTIDELTGLFNSTYFRARLKEEIQRSIVFQRPCSLMVLRIDDYSHYLNSHDRAVAETALQRVSQLLRQNIEAVDQPARLGEGEFGIILPEKNRGEASVVAEKIRRKIESTPFPYGHTQPMGKVTVTCVVAANPIDGITDDELITKAFRVMVEAGSEKKNRILFVDT